MLPESLKEHPTAAGVEVFAADAVVTGKLDRGELTLEIAPMHVVRLVTFEPVSSLVPTTCPPLIPPPPNTSDQHEG